MFNATVEELEVLKISYKAHLRIHESISQQFHSLGPYVSTEYAGTI